MVLFGKKLEETDFSCVYLQKTPTDMVENFQMKMSNIIEESFPLKSITISNEDQVWFNEDLRALKRARLREYNRHGKTQKYINLKNKFDIKFRQEFFKYKEKITRRTTGARGCKF